MGTPTLVLHPKQAEKLAGMMKAMTLHAWMKREDGLAFFRFPMEGKNAARLAAILIEYPEHRFEVKEPFLGVFRSEH